MNNYLRVAVLVDLSRDGGAGGHVKYWERMAQAAVKEKAPIELTVYYSGDAEDEVLSPHVRYRFLPPEFSTTRLKFLPYVPAHTDLAHLHPALARELETYDVIHATEGFFAFTRTAERVSRQKHIPLVTSFHTDTPAYAEIFTHQTIKHIFGHAVGGTLDALFKISAGQRRTKLLRLRSHLKRCAAILAMRHEDIMLAQNVAPEDKIKPMRLGVDKDLFVPQAHTRAAIEKEYDIPAGKLLVLFVGRIDAGKNMPVLMQACANAITNGVKVHLLVAGLGHLADEVKETLGDNVTLAGMVEPRKLAGFYAAADCLAIASDIEIGGMIGVEALACGCPVLVSRQSGVAQLCGDTPAMRMVESGVSAWTQALVDYAKDEPGQKSMRAAALAFREDKLASWGEVLKEDFIPIWQAVAHKGKNNVR
jgi:glycosyltransferase involved in cell wall biosynthesis